MIKLIVCDLDGTLLNSKQQISSYNARMLNLARKNGISYMIASGRSMELIRPLLREYNLKCGCILMNGAEVRNENEEILSTININKITVPSIHSELVKRGYLPLYTTNDGVYYSGTRKMFEDAIGHRQKCLDRTCFSEAFEEIVKKGLKSEYARQAKAVEKIEDIIKNESIEIRKIVVFNSDKNKNKETREWLNSRFQELAITSSYPENIEINDKYAQKGYGLKKAINALNIAKEEIAVFGDGINDMSLFSEFPFSYAMANAVPEIKKVAHEVILSNDEDGVGKKIEEILKSREMSFNE